MQGPRVCVIGGGATGLSAAHYLKKRGYDNVRVLERRDRVGGLCDSFSRDGVGFDLGGNYVLPHYSHVRALAKEIGAQLTVGPGRITWDHTMNGGVGGFRSTLAGVLQGTTALDFGLASIRYARLLFEHRAVMGAEGFGGVAAVPELCEPFSRFLERFRLQPMKNLFLIPITIMGYGAPGKPGEYSPHDPEYFDDVAACYVLKYVNFETFLLLLTVGVGLPVSWPRRFADGYQRFWEAMAWRLDVRLSADVKSVRRGDVVEVTYDWRGEEVREDFDMLVLACPLPAALAFLDVNDEERRLFSAVRARQYFINIVEVEGLRDKIHDVTPLTPFGHPWAVVKQWPQSDLCVTYSPVSPEVSDEDAKRWVKEDIEKMGGRVKGFRQWRRWSYFPHLSPEDLRAGTWDALEALQGRRRTVILGGVMSFELVERAVAYSKRCVERYFPELP